MKNNFFICAALTAALITTSCDQEKPGRETGVLGEGPQITLAFENEAITDGGTRAFGAGTTEAWEKSISSATVMVFNAEGDIKFRRNLSTSEIANAPTTPISLIVPDLRVGETATFVVVANRTVPLSVTTMDLLRAETDSDIANYNGTFSNVSSKALRPGGFVMSGQSQQKISEKTKVAITLRRTVAKVEVSMATSAAFKNKYGPATLSINKISLSRGTLNSYLMDHSASAYAPEAPFSCEQTSSEGRNLFYIFEKAEAAEGNRPQLTIYATYDIDGVPTTTKDQIPVIYKVELKGIGNGKILRNGAYRINGVIDGLTGQDISISISVAPWETVQTQDVTLGK